MLTLRVVAVTERSFSKLLLVSLLLVYPDKQLTNISSSLRRNLSGLPKPTGSFSWASSGGFLSRKVIKTPFASP